MASDTALPYREQVDKEMSNSVMKEIERLSKGPDKGKSGKGSGGRGKGKGSGSKADKGMPQGRMEASRGSPSAFGTIKPIRDHVPMVNLQEQQVDMRSLEVRSRNPRVCTLQYRQLELLRDSLRRARDALDSAHRGLAEMAHRVEAESKVTSVAHEVVQAILQEQLPD